MLAQGLTVVLENGFWSRAEREEALREGRVLGAAELVSFDRSPG